MDVLPIVAARAASGQTHYDDCPGGTTMHGCCAAVSLAHAAPAASAERLLRRARNRTLPPNGVVGSSSTCAVLSRPASASCTSVAAARASIGLLNAPTWIAQAPPLSAAVAT